MNVLADRAPGSRVHDQGHPGDKRHDDTGRPQNYRVSIKPAVKISFRGFDVFSTSAPSSGAVCLSMLKTMEQYPGVGRGATPTSRCTGSTRPCGSRTAPGPRSATRTSWRGVGQLEARLLSDSAAERTRRKILDNATQPVEVYDPSGYYASPGHGTSHVVTVDGSGMAVSSTTTVNLLFGAAIMTPDSGIIINDQMNDFSIPGANNEFGFPPSPANFIRPGKRPMSSITPVMAQLRHNGALVLATGAAGGSRIISATAQIAWNVLERGMSMADALAEPRLHDS